MTDSEKLKRLRTAATTLYFAGRWELNSFPPTNSTDQAMLWEALREALELEAGVATKAGVHG